MATNNYARRRRNAVLAAIAMALVFVIIVVIIIVGVAGGDKKDPSTPTKTPLTALPTIPPATDDPVTGTDDPFNSADPFGSDEPTTPTPTADADAGTRMYLTGDGVNVRKEADASSDKITSLKKGTMVTAYEETNGFYRVKLSDGKTGYISSKYLSEENSGSEATATNTPTATPDTSKGKAMYVNADSVNVRDGASTTANKVASLKKSTEVVAYATKDGWTYIRYSTSGSGKYGYISSKYLSEKDATPAPTENTATATAGATPTPTAAPKKSFTTFGIPKAIADIIDGNTSYLDKTKAMTGMDIKSDPDEMSYYRMSTTDDKTFYIIFRGSSASPTFADISDTKPQ